MTWGFVITSLALVALVAATPFVVAEVIRGRVDPATANWISIAVGGLMLIAIAIAWVLMRARRNAARDRAKGLEPS